MEKEPIVVNIDGKRYILPAQEDREHIQRIADLTDRRIRETRVANPALSREEAAVSAALSIADELVRANHELLRLRKQRGKQPGASEKN
ncbi:MAG: cell division protein ZapA [Christensenellales bacterium]|jgi:cell division protein ZapA (FtsZ GTPase activity inhibitor)